MMTRAGERNAAYLNEEGKLADKALFVHNLGWLLSQTRNEVRSIDLDPENPDKVIITYATDETVKVNIALDSYIAIVRDVAKNI